MAPNRHRLTHIPLELRNYVLSSPKSLNLNQNVASDYTLPSKPVAPTASYWDWPATIAPEDLIEEDEVATEKVNLFSVDHIVANLVETSKTFAAKRQDIDSVVYNDSDKSATAEYWTEGVSQLDEHVDEICQVTQPLQEQEKVVYWNEKTLGVDGRTKLAVSSNHPQYANYWDEASPASHHSIDSTEEANSLSHNERCNYWCEPVYEHTNKSTSSTAPTSYEYWYTPSATVPSAKADRIPQGSYDYWSWSSSAPHMNDNYWNENAVIMGAQ